MTKKVRIIFCRCAYGGILPQDVKERVLSGLKASGVAFEQVADLCELVARRDPKLGELAQGDEIRVAACFPRAVRGLFAAAGVELAIEAGRVGNMRTESADAVVRSMVEGVEPFTPAGDGAVAPVLGQWKPWFPVIDYGRCTNCMQCLSFCLFDVYGVSAGGKLQVAKPANCKTDCPACSRVCPEVAIMFPKYKAGPINGAEIDPAEVRREAIKVDISGLLGGDVYAALRTRSERSRSRFSQERDEGKALAERQACLAKLMSEMDIPASALAGLPSPEEIRVKAEQAKAKAEEALRLQAGEPTKG